MNLIAPTLIAEQQLGPQFGSGQHAPEPRTSVLHTADYFLRHLPGVATATLSSQTRPSAHTALGAARGAVSAGLPFLRDRGVGDRRLRGITARSGGGLGAVRRRGGRGGRLAASHKEPDHGSGAR